eukprot:879943-Rhodomonas_salina.1
MSWRCAGRSSRTGRVECATGKSFTLAGLLWFVRDSEEKADGWSVLPWPGASPESLIVDHSCTSSTSTSSYRFLNTPMAAGLRFGFSLLSPRLAAIDLSLALWLAFGSAPTGNSGGAQLLAPARCLCCPAAER